MQLEGIIAAGQVVALVFAQDAVAASQTDAQLNIQEVNAGATLAISGLTMPFNGSIIAITANLSAAATAGTLTTGATINGTESATTTQTITTATEARAKFGREAVRFSAGDELGVEITTDGSWDGTASDLAVVLYVLLDLEGI